MQKYQDIGILKKHVKNGSKDLPYFLHGCRGQWGTLFEQSIFSVKILNHKL